MFKSKRWLAGMMAMAMILSLAACGGGSASTQENSTAAPSDTQQSADQATSDAPAAAGDLTEWEQSSGILNVDQTEAELYELAKQEGKLTVYSISSRTTKVVEAFMKKYPGIEVVSFDVSTNELLEKVTREYDAGQHIADAIHIKDQDGSLYNEYVLAKKLYNYTPAAIASHIEESLRATQTPLYIELTQLFYNEEAYPDGPPFTNIWAITEPEWKGRIMMQNPLDNVSWGSWIAGFCVGETPAQLEAAYKELTGEDLVLSPECENAGYEFLKRLHANAPIFTSSSDEIAQSVGTRGQTNPPIGFCASSKLRKNIDNDWCLVPINLYPTTGIPAINTMYVVEGCLNPNAAKLYISFTMGGTDGDTSGNDPFNTLGGWPVRDDIQPEEGSVPYSEINVSNFNPTDIYDNINIVRDFWQLL